MRSIRSLQHKREPSIIPQMSMTAQVSAPLSAPTPAHMPAHFFTDISKANSTSSKPRVHKASRNPIIPKNPHKYTQEEGPQVDWASVHDPLTTATSSFGRDKADASAYRASDGRVRCPCGGIYNPSKGAGSWKAHVKTKRHALWGGRHVDEDQRNFALAHTHTSEVQGNYVLHTSENQGNYVIAQPHNTSEDQGNYTAAMSYNGNDQGNYAITQPHIYEEQGSCSSEHYLAGTTTMLEGRDISTKQEEAAEEAKN